MMTPTTLEAFQEIWAVDFEFYAPNGERPHPLCVVARNVRTGEVLRRWLETDPSPPPFLSRDHLYVAFYASAEIGCHHALKWTIPSHICDLFAEHRALTNGLPGVANGLIGACTYWGANAGSAVVKDDMRERIMAGPPYSQEEQAQILDYCEDDVRATTNLFQLLQPRLDVPRMLLRGRFMAAIAAMEYRGIPMDTELLPRLKTHWDTLKLRLIADMDQHFGIYEGETFKLDRFERYLQKRGIAWTRTETGRLSLTDDVFKDMTRTYPDLQPLRDLRYILGQLRLNDLPVGSDSRNRCLLSPFQAKTGRCAPSTSKFIFGPAVWLRGLIKPEPGRALAYVDYSQQEFALAAYLSGDQKMIEAYESGDPYLSFAQMAGAAPPGATKQTLGAIRDQFKTCALGVQYGMGDKSLAIQLDRPVPYATELIRHHKRTFKRFWEWQEQLVDNSLLEKRIRTTLGWQFQVIGDSSQIPTLRNWAMQATGAEILRVAAIMLDDAGIEVLCPVHDAFLIEAAADEIDTRSRECQRLMEEASRQVLGGAGFVRTDVEIITHPARYADPRGQETWTTVMRLLDEIEAGA